VRPARGLVVDWRDIGGSELYECRVTGIHVGIYNSPAAAGVFCFGCSRKLTVQKLQMHLERHRRFFEAKASYDHLAVLKLTGGKYRPRWRRCQVGHACLMRKFCPTHGAYNRESCTYKCNPSNCESICWVQQRIWRVRLFLRTLGISLTDTLAESVPFPQDIYVCSLFRNREALHEVHSELYSAPSPYQEAAQGSGRYQYKPVTYSSTHWKIGPDGVAQQHDSDMHQLAINVQGLIALREAIDECH